MAAHELLSCCWLELQLHICWLMLAAAIIQVRGPPCSVLLSPEFLEMLVLALLFPMPYFVANGSASEDKNFNERNLNQYY